VEESSPYSARTKLRYQANTPRKTVRYRTLIQYRINSRTTLYFQAGFASLALVSIGYCDIYSEMRVTAPCKLFSKVTPHSSSSSWVAPIASASCAGTQAGQSSLGGMMARICHLSVATGDGRVTRIVKDTGFEFYRWLWYES
jgi:hypothetical protein